MSEEIHKKFDKAEAAVDRTIKLILKIVTGLAGLIAGIFFAWGQLKDNLNLHHVHEEDQEFQEYLKEVEGEENYNAFADSAYEDSLYKEFYTINEVESIFSVSVEEEIFVDTIIRLVTDTLVDTIEKPAQLIEVDSVLEQVEQINLQIE